MKKTLLVWLMMFATSLIFSQYSVNFEAETKGAYASGTVSLNGINWNMTEALIGSAPNDYKTGLKSARLRGRNGSVMSMIADKTTGLGTLSFNYKEYGTDVSQQPWAVEYSLNGGGLWTQIGVDITPNNSVQTFSELVNVMGNVRVRIRLITTPGTTGNRRFNIDEINLTDNTCVPVAISSVSPTSGSEGTNITITASAGDLSSATATIGGVATTVVSSSATTLVLQTSSSTVSGDIVISDSQPCDVTYSSFTVLDSDTTGCDFVASFTELFISEVTDASSGSLSYIEIFNATGVTVDMTDYEVRIRNNGNPTGDDIALIGSLAHGDSFILATAVASSCGNPGSNAELADQTDVSSGVNNNDCIHLAKLGTVIDTWGVCDGTNWITTAGLGSAGYDFQRKSTAVAPSTIFALADWTIIDFNACNDNYSDIENYVGTNLAPIITLQPILALNPCDISTSFTVGASEGVAGGQGLIYQWYVNVPGALGWTTLTNAGVYTGATSTTLNISSVIGLDNYQYYCEVRESGATCYTSSETVLLSSTISSVWNGTVWSSAPNITRIVIVDADYDTAVNGSFDACSLIVNTGVLLDVKAGDYINIVNDLTVNGDLQVRHEGSLVQVSDSGLVTVGASGNIDVHKTTSTLQDWWSYTFWASPVVNETIGGALSASHPSYRFVFNPNNYSDVSPADGADDNGDDWTFTPSATVIAPGLGYVAMGPTTGSYPQSQDVQFNGQLNNGVVTAPVSMAGNPDTWNLIGNPYASAIDIHTFATVNTGLVENTVYLWNHRSAPLTANSGPYGYNFDTDDFATYNVAMASGTAANSGGVAPSRYIASGQSFFLRGVSSGNAVFNNSMRVKGNNNNFFKQSVVGVDQKDLIWLNLENDEAAFNQILVGFVDGANNQVDKYDSKKRRSAKLSFYSMVGENEFTIQGRQPLVGEEEIPLGIISKVPGLFTYRISLDHLEGNFDSYDVYLEDKELNVLHDVINSSYEFVLDEGVYNSRFALVLKKKTAVLDISDLTELHLFQNDNMIIAQAKTKIVGFELFDVRGRQIYELTPNSLSVEVDSEYLSNGVYVAKFTLENNKVVSKKLLKK